MLRFLAGCHRSELTAFTDLLLLPFQTILGEAALLTCFHGNRHCLSLPAEAGGLPVVAASQVVPLRVQLGFLTTLSQLFAALGDRLLPLLPTLLSLLVGLGSSCGQLLAQRNTVSSASAGPALIECRECSSAQIQPFSVPTLRRLRQLVIAQITEVHWYVLLV